MARWRWLLLCLLAHVSPPRVDGLLPEQHELQQASTRGGFGGLAPEQDELQLASSRRGVGGNLVGPQIEALKGLAWFYNWGTRLENATAAAEAVALGLEFVPMQWGRWGADSLQIPPGAARVLLGFNEPNHRKQANLTPREAAELWPLLEDAAAKHGLRLGGPCPAPCGADCLTPDPFSWLDAFFGWCDRLRPGAGCRVDFLATHYYACDAQWLVSYLREYRVRYGRPVWLTEWACPNPSGPPSRTWQFMAAALSALDGDPWVERYAWFAVSDDAFQWLGPSNSLMDVRTNQLTETGELYLNYRPFSAAGDSGGAAPAGAQENDEPGAHEESWSSRCRPCLQALQGGGGLAALGSEAAELCSRRCGFWVKPGGSQMQVVSES